MKRVVLDTNILLVACTEDKHFRVLKKVAFPPVNVISADDFVEMLTGVRPSKK